MALAEARQFEAHEEPHQLAGTPEEPAPLKKKHSHDAQEGGPMRDHGRRFELVPMRPNDHIGWVYSGLDEFVALSVPFLAEGASRKERLMFVAEDPDPDPLAELAESVEPGALQVASIAEVYGASGIVDPQAQRDTFAGVLAEALEDGYSGIRVAADNTPLVTDDERLRAWINWEIVADHFMSEKAVTGLCAFDQEQTSVDVLRHLATLHPLSSADSPVPQFRLYADGGSLLVDGELDATAMDYVWLALENLPAKTEVVMDLTKTTRAGKGVMSGIRQLCDQGVGLTIRGTTEMIDLLAERVGPGAADVSWVAV
jgi:hypothetical protein